MKRIVIGDFVEYNYPKSKLGNYHICNQFVKHGYEALWVSNTYNELIRLKDKEDYNCKKALSRPFRHRLADNVYGFAAWSWRLYGNYPFCRDPRIIKNMRRTISPRIDKSLGQMGFDDVDVLWISNPKLFWLADVVKYDRLCYRIADDYAQFENFPNIADLEAQFIHRADHVFVTSRLLEEKVARQGKKPVLLNNAVDKDFFSREQPLPAEFRGTDRKRILYVGFISYWFDIELISQLAQSVDADIYIVGPEKLNLDRIRSFTNVHILGARAYEDVPAYMQHADAAIIPFVTGKLTEAISPLKLYEYCAAGTPVVSSYIEEVAQIGAPVYLATDHADFISGVQKALQSPESTAVLQEFAARNSWEQRFRVIMEEFNE